MLNGFVIKLRLIVELHITHSRLKNVLNACKLFMQEFSPYISMLISFNMTRLESSTTMFLEGQPGQYHGTLAHAAQL